MKPNGAFRIEVLARKDGLGVAGIAAKCGIPERTMDRIHSGASNPSARHLIAIIRAYRLPYDFFETDDFPGESE